MPDDVEGAVGSYLQMAPEDGTWWSRPRPSVRPLSLPFDSHTSCVAQSVRRTAACAVAGHTHALPCPARRACFIHAAAEDSGYLGLEPDWISEQWELLNSKLSPLDYFSGQISLYCGGECGGQKELLIQHPQTVQISRHIAPFPPPHTKISLGQ